MDRLCDSAIHLISPPPEETLRRTRPSSPPAAKRKRSIVVEPATTPNPRSRKQPRDNGPTHSPSHSENTNPLLTVRSRRSRSATPIPPYEPPTDIFTPPKQVFVSPATATIRVSKSSKRKSAKKKKRSPTPVLVKLEMPHIDLTAPMPPPSPGDDPLLLTGPSSSPTKPRGPAFSESDLFDIRKDTTPNAPTRRTTSPTPAAFIKKLRFDDLPPSSPPQVNISSPMLDTDMPFFDLNRSSDSDEDDLPILSEPVSEPQDGEGDYTGKWKDVFVRTKADPPNTSRVDKWPFPLSLEKAPPFALVHQEDDDQLNAEPDPFDFSSISPPQRRQLSPELGQVEQDRGPSDAEDAFKLMGNQPEKDSQVEQSAPLEELESSPEHTEPPPVDAIQQSEPASDEEQQSPETAYDDHTEPAQQSPEPTSDEEQPISDDHPQHTEPASDEEHPISDDHPQYTESTPVKAAAEEDDNSSSDAEDEPDIVKITSTDPRAAARAAAILKQHNYDCFTRKELKRRYSNVMRRRSSSPFELARAVFEGGVRKKNERRRTTIGGMGVRGENVFIPGSPMTTLPNLLKDVEAEVSMEQSPNNPFSTDPNPFKTPLPNRNSSFLFSGSLTGLGLTPKVPMTPGETCYDPLTGERMWTKEEWKRLDACFTDERLEVGARSGLMEDDGLASVDLVDLENVLKRFVEWMGGEDAVAEYGPDWSRENLMQRTRALRRKQRRGKVAPPTTLPFSPISPASPWSFGSGGSKTMIEVPEFTPIRFKPLQKREWISHSSAGTETPLRFSQEEETNVNPVPPTLLAPRYSHLLEEAISISRDLPPFPPSDAGTDSQGSDTLLDDQGHEHESDASPMTLVEGSEFIPDSSPAPEDVQQPDTIGKRVKGILFSYLPTLKKPTTKNPKRPEQPGLPLPPQGVLTKPRGPVVTPAREPPPKAIPPKNLVHLQQAPPMQTPTSKISKVVHPKELVELNHVTPKVTDEHERRRERRRSSGAGSVKDLIKGFENMENQNKGDKVEVRKEVRRMKSIGEWRKGLNGVRNGGDMKRPLWKP